MDKPESYEVTEYGNPHNNRDMYSTITQIVQDKERESPAFCVRAAFTGNMLKLTYMSYEMHAPTRMRQIVEVGDKCIKEMLKHIKKEYKKQTKDKIDFKENKDLSNYTLQKVSLNERYMYTKWCMYEIAE